MKGKQEMDDRKKRVQRLKKVIISILAFLILIPTVLCIVLFIQVGQLQNQLNRLADVIEQIGQGYGEDEILTSNLENTDNSESPLSSVIEDYWKEKTVTDEENLQDFKKVYLTFDDGPSSNTDRILDILEEYQVKATFFVTGKTDEKSKERYRRIVEEGHTLGMHSYSHKYDEIYQSLDSFREDLNKLQEYLYLETGVWSRYYRFPGGSSNTVSGAGMEEFITYLNDQGIVYYDWNVSSRDASSSRLSAEEITENVLEQTGVFDSMIVLMHDAVEKDTTVEALPAIIEAIQAMDDVILCSIDDETIPVQHVSVE